MFLQFCSPKKRQILVYLRRVIFAFRKKKNKTIKKKKKKKTHPTERPYTWKVRPAVKQGFFFFMA